MHEAMLKVASVLGYSIATCTLFWPIAFAAVKGSLKLTVKWWLFVIGYAMTIGMNAVVLAAVGYLIATDPTQRDAFDWVQVTILYGIPLVISIGVALVLSPYQRTPPVIAPLAK